MNDHFRFLRNCLLLWVLCFWRILVWAVESHPIPSPTASVFKPDLLVCLTSISSSEEGNLLIKGSISNCTEKSVNISRWGVQIALQHASFYDSTDPAIRASIRLDETVALLPPPEYDILANVAPMSIVPFELLYPGKWNANASGERLFTYKLSWNVESYEFDSKKSVERSEELKLFGDGEVKYIPQNGFLFYILGLVGLVGIGVLIRFRSLVLNGKHYVSGCLDRIFAALRRH